MPTPLDDHGGIHPGPFHISTYPSIQQNLVLCITATQSDIVLDCLKTSLFDRITTCIYFLPKSFPEHNLRQYHPTVKYIKDIMHPEQQREFVRSLIQQQNIPQIFVYCIRDIDLLHPKFWDILETATYENHTSFRDETGKEHTLYAVHAEQRETPTLHIPTIAAYANPMEDRERLIDSIEHAIQRKTRTRLHEYVFGIERSFTPLCHLATKYQTDKTPFMFLTHRHPYTPVYDMFLRQFQRKKDLVLGEVGILNGASIRMWRDYFPFAQLHAFDISTTALVSVKDVQNCKSYLVDAGSTKGLRESLHEATEGGKLFDILLDDASHRLDHQLLFLRDAIDFVAPGGVLIIEDIFREIPAARFQEALDQISDKVHNAVLVRPEHPLRSSPQWENDRILFVWRA
jgi:hypothetical protein